MAATAAGEGRRENGSAFLPVLYDGGSALVVRRLGKKKIYYVSHNIIGSRHIVRHNDTKQDGLLEKRINSRTAFGFSF